MSLATTSTFRYRLCRSEGADQSLQIRLRFLWRLLSRSPSAGLPYDILHEIPSSLMREATFPLYLRELEDPLVCEAYIAQLLSSLYLGALTCEIMARKITSVLVEVLESGNYDTKFEITAEIDHVQMFWVEEDQGSSVPVENGGRRGVVVEEKVVLEEAPARRRAAETERESKRLKKEKFDGFERRELGDCSVCYEELNDVRKEVSRIRCGHVYHKSCILTWVQRSNSCPLCRREIQFQV